MLIPEGQRNFPCIRCYKIQIATNQIRGERLSLSFSLLRLCRMLKEQIQEKLFMFEQAKLTTKTQFYLMMCNQSHLK